MFCHNNMNKAKYNIQCYHVFFYFMTHINIYYRSCKRQPVWDNIHVHHSFPQTQAQYIYTIQVHMC